MIKKTNCKNYNHTRILVQVQYCPNCGERFNVHTDIKNCTETIHAERRKNKDSFCCDCGLDLKLASKNTEWY